MSDVIEQLGASLRRAWLEGYMAGGATAEEAGAAYVKARRSEPQLSAKIVPLGAPPPREVGAVGDLQWTRERIRELAYECQASYPSGDWICQELLRIAHGQKG